MRGIICYYSGSGNTKLACQYIVKNITSIEFDFFNIVTDGIPDLEKYDIVGLATFTDFLGAPYLMNSFIRKLPPQKNKFAFVFNTYGFISGKTSKLLENFAAKKGFKVIIGHSLHAPENYPPMIVSGKGSKLAPNEKEMKRFDIFISELNRLIHLIEENKQIRSERIRIGLLNQLLPVFSRTKARKSMGLKYVNEKLCTECGLCEKLCPYKAIKLNPKPIFNMNKCYGCWACYNHCFAKAIYTKKYRGVGQYSMPNDQLKEKLKI